jgi:hypothetical protein
MYGGGGMYGGGMGMNNGFMMNPSLLDTANRLDPKIREHMVKSAEKFLSHPQIQVRRSVFTSCLAVSCLAVSLWLSLWLSCGGCLVVVL